MRIQLCLLLWVWEIKVIVCSNDLQPIQPYRQAYLYGFLWLSELWGYLKNLDLLTEQQQTCILPNINFHAINFIIYSLYSKIGAMASDNFYSLMVEIQMEALRETLVWHWHSWVWYCTKGSYQALFMYILLTLWYVPYGKAFVHWSLNVFRVMSVKSVLFLETSSPCFSSVFFTHFGFLSSLILQLSYY